jgi:hypothetical protein
MAVSEEMEKYPQPSMRRLYEFPSTGDINLSLSRLSIISPKRANVITNNSLLDRMKLSIFTIHQIKIVIAFAAYVITPLDRLEYHQNHRSRPCCSIGSTSHSQSASSVVLKRQKFIHRFPDPPILYQAKLRVDSCPFRALLAETMVFLRRNFNEDGQIQHRLESIDLQAAAATAHPPFVALSSDYTETACLEKVETLS